MHRKPNRRVESSVPPPEQLLIENRAGVDKAFNGANPL